MVYIVAYRLKRKNARRKIAMKMNCSNLSKAMEDFKRYVDHVNDPKRSWELLSGDWKVITYYETCAELHKD